MESFLLILNSFKTVFSLLIYLWWVYLPIFLFFIAYFAIQNYTHLKYKLGLEWILLEMKVPKEVRKSPKAMEQVFAGLHGVYSIPVKWHQKFFGGKFPAWYSFEIVGKGGETHFYIRTTRPLKDVVEAQIYAQYPEAEIFEVPDYINDLPLYLPDDQYDLWGTDLMLSKSDAYPIRTYPDFEERVSMAKEEVGVVARIDPLASLVELCSTLHAGEQIWVQILGAPTGDSWVKKGQAELDKLMGKTPVAQKGNFLSDMVFAVDKAISGAIPGPTVDKKDEKRPERPEKPDLTPSPGKRDIMIAMEKSWDKLGYEAAIRFLYIGRKDNFHQAHAAGLTGAFRQFSSMNLNGFKVNKYTLTYAKGLFKKSKLFKRKRLIYQSYKDRNLFGFGVVRYVLNTEELATIFHFPDVGVKSPFLPRVEAKKGEPPVGLPIM